MGNPCQGNRCVGWGSLSLALAANVEMPQFGGGIWGDFGHGGVTNPSQISDAAVWSIVAAASTRTPLVLLRGLRGVFLVDFIDHFCGVNRLLDCLRRNLIADFSQDGDGCCHLIA